MRAKDNVKSMNKCRKYIFFLAVVGLVVMNFLPINGDKDDPPFFILGLRHDLWLHIIAFLWGSPHGRIVCRFANKG